MIATVTPSSRVSAAARSATAAAIRWVPVTGIAVEAPTMSSLLQDRFVRSSTVHRPRSPGTLRFR